MKDSSTKLAGAEIRRVRRSKGLTQIDLAKKLKCTQGYVSRVEKGEHNITLKVLEDFARALKVKVRIELIE